MNIKFKIAIATALLVAAGGVATVGALVRDCDADPPFPLAVTAEGKARRHSRGKCKGWPPCRARS